MAEIKSLLAVKEKWARVTPMRTEDYKLGIQNPKTAGKSSFYITPRHKKPVNRYKLIRKLNRIIKLQKQRLYLLTQEIKELKGQ